MNEIGVKPEIRAWIVVPVMMVIVDVVVAVICIFIPVMDVVVVVGVGERSHNNP